MTRERDIRNAYSIATSTGSIIATIYENERDRSSTSLVLHGRGANFYGNDRNENLVRLLENFANDTAPSNPIDGQFWWNTDDSLLYVRNEVGSPGIWQTVVPPFSGIGFNVVAGDGLTGGGFPTGSPLSVTVNVGAGNGITVSGSPGLISTNDSEIDHDQLSGFVANEHIDHSAVTITAGDGLTGGGTIDGDVTINVNAGEGLIAQSNTLTVQTGDDGVVMTTGSQSIYGAKIFSDQVRADGITSAAVPAYGFRNDSDTIFQSGIYRSGANELSFSTNGVQAFRVESNGVLRALKSNYETFVTNDDVIPNKKYVDEQVATAGISPTTNQHVGTSGISGLDGDQTYLVNAYGVIPSKGTGFDTLDSVILRRGSTTPGVGTFVDAAPSQVIDWPDGDMPSEVAFICEMNGDTRINVQFSAFVGRNAMHMTAVQLTDN